MKMKKFVYVNGDSYTAGDELLDGAIPGYTAVMPRVNKPDITPQQRKLRSDYYSKKDYHAVVADQKKLAWPTKLQHMDSSIEVFNNAVGGSSVAGIAARTVTDLLKLRNKGILPKIVFIQLTSLARIEVHGNFGATYLRSAPATFAITDHSNTKLKNIAMAYVQEYNDVDWALKYLNDLLLLKNSIIGITGVEPIFLSTQLVTVAFDLIEQLSKDADIIVELLGLLKINLDPKNRPMEEFEGDFVMAMGHPVQSCHDQYAAEIYNSYLKGM